MDARRDVLLRCSATATGRFSTRGAAGRRRTAAEPSTSPASGAARDRRARGQPVRADCCRSAPPVPAEGAWRDETHQVCDRPGFPTGSWRKYRLASGAGDRRVVGARAGRPTGGRRTGRPPRPRRGTTLSLTADLRDSLERHRALPQLFPVRPAHSPLGPLDFSGADSVGSALHRRRAGRSGRGRLSQFIQAGGRRGGERIETVNLVRTGMGDRGQETVNRCHLQTTNRKLQTDYASID